MAVYTVTTADDVVNAGDGVLSLREAVARANASPAADEIVFARSLEGMTLTLTRGELLLSQDVIIDGDVNGDGVRVTLSGGGNSRLFQISGPATDVTLDDIGLINGRVVDADGGAILHSGASLTLNNALIRNSESVDPAGYYFGGGSGGGIAADRGALLTITASSLAYNRADRGGAIALAVGAKLDARATVIHNNRSYWGGGGVAAENESQITVRDSSISSNWGGWGGGGLDLGGGNLYIERSRIADNENFNYVAGAGLRIGGAAANIIQSTFSGNRSEGDGSAIASYGGELQINTTTVAQNSSGILIAGGSLSLANSTITSNFGYRIYEYDSLGRGIVLLDNSSIVLSNNIVVGNGSGTKHYDLLGRGAVALISNGHNVFGRSVLGVVAGDRVNVLAGTVFATIDPVSGGGVINAQGVVPLRNNVANPALSAADRFAAVPVDQLGNPRPRPIGTRADLGAVELDRALSTTPSANNDLLTGTSAANPINAGAGNDYIRGLGGADRLNGQTGSDLIEGGPGNDVIDGGTGVDAALFGGTVAVVAQLGGAAPSARRGSETNRLVSIEGLIGSSAADTFTGDNNANWFMGGAGRDILTGAGGRDTFDYNVIADSPATTTGRDRITDFTPGVDKIDLSAIDADVTTPGDQAFRWVGTAPFTGTPGELGYFIAGGNTIIRASVNANPTADLHLELAGTRILSANDFYR